MHEAPLHRWTSVSLPFRESLLWAKKHRAEICKLAWQANSMLDVAGEKMHDWMKGTLLIGGGPHPTIRDVGSTSSDPYDA